MVAESIEGSDNGIDKTISLPSLGFNYWRALFLLEWRSALSYRMNFIVQTLGMFANDSIWVFFWVLLFQKFNRIGSWNFADLRLLYAVTTTAVGIVNVFFGNAPRLARLIDDGKLDYYLTLPRNILLNSCSRLQYSGVGDLLFGIVIASFSLSVSMIPLFILLVALVSLLLLGWGILVNATGFFLNRWAEGARMGWFAILTFGVYPFSAFSGTARMVLLLVIPAGFIGGVPVELLKNFSSFWLGALVLASFLWCVLAVLVFYFGLRRYSSGNMLGMRG